MPLTSPFIGRQLTRNIPFAAQRTFVQALAAAGALVVEFDVGLVVTDGNQLLAGGPVGAGTVQHAVGPFLDCLAFSPGTASIAVDFAVDGGAGYRNIATTPVAASTPVNISGLRITGRFCRVTFTNTSGAQQNVEFGAYCRST